MEDKHRTAWPWVSHDSEHENQVVECGLTKREYFAALAMQAICTNAGRNGFNFSAHIDIAKESFLIADAMIEVKQLNIAKAQSEKAHGR